MTQTEHAAAEGLNVRDLEKAYPLGAESLDVLTGVTLSADRGEIAAIMGPSGAGKTTLLNCIAGIDVADSGDIEIAGSPFNYASERERTRRRRHDIGMVFQFFNLVPTLTVRENVALPLMIGTRSVRVDDAHIDALIDKVGLAGRARHRPYQLSGGEMQLVSIARALVHRPALLLADEPTGNVNPAIGESIMSTLTSLARDENTAVIIVTHSPEHAAWADRICFLKDGRIADELVHRAERDQVSRVYDHLVRLGI